ncbi:heterokaryon incompatibility protein-domain-containing protein [Podospora appendiculata]|uniref:Heterokaryon incompatibility protein-domain-containing protein n=1 Tax=Podospora appendiculata TaxID=314037 RepID=A0AAE0X9Q0_9PEZI|nr:heterokaryon incompatibility protein-domain-containing protein [Podospora appendiculata]
MPISDKDKLQCAICRSSLANPRDLGEKVTSIEFKVSDLLESDRTGCGFCRVLLEAAHAKFSEELKCDPKLFLLFHRGTEGRTGTSLALHSYEEDPWVSLDIYLTEDHVDNAHESLPLVQAYPPGLGKVKEVPLAAESLETWDFIISQLQNCAQNHTTCHRAHVVDPETSLPARLLRLQKEGNITTARLVSIYSLDNPKYVALSYSWGYTPDQPPLTTTHSNIAQMQAGIDLASAPLCLQDAMFTCLHLGIELLWIDSLCIIQDDAGDWAVESSKMGAVYRNAFLTIISASTSSCHDKFLTKTREGSQAIARTQNGAKEGLIRVRRSPKGGHHLRWHEVYPRAPIDPIDTRAWTIQERALSTRSIMLTGVEVQWECRESKSCECGLEAEETVREYIKFGLDPANKWKPMSTWETLLVEYSRRRLTVEADRLPAIAALARMIAPSIGSDYFAGLWKKELLTGLCWSVWNEWYFAGAPDSRQPYFSKTYVAPSVSWASVIGQIKYTNSRVTLNKLDWLASVVSCYSSHGAGDQFSRVTEAYVDLKVPLLSAAIVDREIGKSYEIKLEIEPGPPNEYGVIQPAIDGPLQRVPLGDGQGFSVQRFRGSLDQYYRTEPSAGFLGAPVYFAPLFANLPATWNESTIWGILLGQLPGKSASYERLGTALCTVDKKKFDFGVFPKHEKVVRIY